MLLLSDVNRLLEGEEGEGGSGLFALNLPWPLDTKICDPFIIDVVSQLVPVRLLPVESEPKTDSSEDYIQL